tara:strand:- start:3532 stop:5229 length:1698 start_codon:yes stop_codon:yes gene_type:complete
MDTIKRSQIEQGDVCFLLDIEYFGAIYRFSTVPIDISDTAENTVIPYRGSLSDPPINLQSDLLGVDLEANTISLELIFEEVDWVSEFLKGRTINDAICTFSMIIIRDGKTSFTQQDRIGIFKGRALEAIFGAPDAPKGTVAFTIENSVNVRTANLLGEEHVIIEDNYTIPILDKSKGKVVPFVFGELGTSSREQAGSITLDTDLRATPAYQAGGTATLKTQYFQVAYHQVMKPGVSLVKIFDGQGGSFTNPVEIAVDSKGFLHAYVPFYLIVGSPEGTNVQYDNFQVSSPEIAFSYYASWGISQGGIPSIIGDGPLEGAVDLSLFVLEKTNLLYDYSSWNGLAPILDRYKFGGFVNDLDVSALDWIQSNIWSLLPIMVVTGGDGIKVALNLYTYSQEIIPTHHLIESGELEIISPLTPLEGEIINKITIRFSYAGMSGAYRSQVTIDPLLVEDEPLKYKDPIAYISFTRYGLREKVVEAPFVYDLQTAIRIARDKIRAHALGNYAIEISAAPKYGYLDLGDIVSITSERVGLTSHKCQIVSKSWSDNRWRYVLHIEDNPLVTIRK